MKNLIIIGILGAAGYYYFEYNLSPLLHQFVQI